MSHHRPPADSSTSSLRDIHPADGPPLIGPQRVPAENTEFTEALSGPPGAHGYPLAGRTAGIHGSNADLGALARIVSLCVPKTPSTSCDQAIFVDRADWRRCPRRGLALRETAPEFEADTVR